MATRKRATGAKAPVTPPVAKAEKKVFKVTDENFSNITNGESRGLQCCAFVEFSGVGAIKSIEDAIALRRAASGDSGSFDFDEFEFDYDWATTKGSVLVTTIPSQSRVYPFLLGAGFQRLYESPGNGTGNRVTLWAATTLKPGVFKKGSGDYEEISI